MPPFVLSRFFHPLISFQFFFFFFNDTPTPEIYPLSLHDALPISPLHRRCTVRHREASQAVRDHPAPDPQHLTPASQARGDSKPGHSSRGHPKPLSLRGAERGPAFRDPGSAPGTADSTPPRGSLASAAA